MRRRVSRAASGSVHGHNGVTGTTHLKPAKRTVEGPVKRVSDAMELC